MSDGFEENAIFFDLEYLEPSVVSADLAFDRIAPILWLAGGCKGEILQRQKGYVIGETYAVLFDPRYTTRFVDAVSENKEIKTVFIVTDAAERYRSLCAELPGCRVMQLYNSANKLFSLSRVAPVGVIVYANAALMTVPIEIIVKQYNDKMWALRKLILDTHILSLQGQSPSAN